MTIFQKIINKEIAAHIVYEDEDVIAILDIMQKTKGHTLVIPKTNYTDIFTLDEKIGQHLFSVVMKLSKAVKLAFTADGVNLINNSGLAANQSVMHYHMHILPRYQGEPLYLFSDEPTDICSNEILTQRALLIKEALFSAKGL